MAHPTTDLKLEPLLVSMLERLWINMAVRTPMPANEAGEAFATPELEEQEQDDRACLSNVARDFNCASPLHGCGLAWQHLAWG